MGLHFVKFHYCEIEFDANYIYRLLNNSGEIRLRNIRTQDKKTTIMVEFSDKEEILEMMERLNIEVLACRDRGIYTFITQFPVIKAAAFVSMIFVLLMMINSLFIWKISVDGNYSYTSNQIIRFVNRLNIKEGIVKNKIDCDAIEKAIRNQYDDISWVCAEVKGTNLMIHIKENYITEISVKEDKPYDLTAGKEAEIVSVLVRKGKPNVKVGDKIKKGHVLISGVVDVFDESEQKLFTHFCNADGEIIGKTVYQYEDKLAIKYQKKVVKKERTYYLPCISGYQWNAFQAGKNRDVSYSQKQWKGFGNFYLPIVMEKYQVSDYTYEKDNYTKKEAEYILHNNLAYKLATMEQKGYKILKKNVKMEKANNQYILSGKIICLEPLGTVSYIDVSKFQEETTQVDEYH